VHLLCVFASKSPAGELWRTFWLETDAARESTFLV
jgi:hypothetical protein